MNKLRTLIRRLCPQFAARNTAALRRRRVKSLQTPSIEALEARQLLTVDIVLNYDYDTNNFLAAAERRATLEAVAAEFEAEFNDTLTAITPAGANNWTAIFNHPTTGSEVRLTNMTLPAGQIIVYVGARNLSGLGIGGPGATSVSGTAAFVSEVLTRGQTGVNPNGTNDTDFSLWGGTITFDTDVNWNFSLDPPVAGQNDFYSVALHEMAHVLGIGTADSFDRLVNGSNQFVGTEAVASYGGPVPMHSDGSHFASDTTSTLPGTSIEQESALDPQITTGTRKQMTVLDWAAIADLGWEIDLAVGPIDYGDAPDATAGASAGNYQTRSQDDGPSHQVIAGLRIGDSVDGDDGTQQNANATADDLSTDDEDFADAEFLTVIEGRSANVSVNVTNTTSTAATLYGWIDYNANGVFESGSESASVLVPVGTDDESVELNFPAPVVGQAGTTFARFRLSSDAAAALPTGAASNGEVEDHQVTILSQSIAYDPLPLLDWNDVANTDYYQLQVDNATTGASGVVLQERLSASEFRLQQAIAPGNYEWRWRAFRNGSFDPWSDVVRFSRFATTGTPFVTDPVGTGIDSLPVFAWSPVEDASRYELWVNGTGYTRIVHQTQLTNPSFAVQNGLPAGNYTAWVRAFDSSNAATSWSSPFTFSLAESNTSVLTDPIGGSLNTTPTFAWLPTAASGTVLQIDDLATGAAVDYEFENLSESSFQIPFGLAPGNYSATVQAAGQAVSAPQTFQILEGESQAQFAQPTGNSENPVPIFSWNSVPGAMRYELWVDDVSNGVARVIHESGLSDTAFATQQPLPAGRYRAWVRAFGAAGAIGTWSDAIDYEVQAAANVPTVWTPFASVSNAAPLIAFSKVSGATHYSVRFGYGPTGGLGALPLDQENLADNFLQIDSTFEPGDYVVTAVAWNGTTQLGSDSARFVVEESNQMQIFSPGGETTNPRPTFAFSHVADASRYVVWVNDLTRGTNALIYRSNLTTPVFVPDSSLLPGDYRVWTRAYDGSTPVSSWSSSVDFTVNEVATAPSVVGTLPTTQSSVPPITWTPVAGADSYDLQIDLVGGTQNPIHQATGLTTTTYRTDFALTPADYLVRVRSVTGGVAGAWSADFALQVQSATQAAFSFPLAGSSIASAELFFAWSTVTDAARYELWINNLTTGAVQVIYDANISSNSFTPASSLAAGRYRAWVRSVAADNSATAWTPSLDFEVV